MADRPVEAAGTARASARSVPRWRRLAVATLVVGGVLAPITVMGVWIHDTLLNTDQYVATVGPLARNSAVQDAIASRVTDELIQHTALEGRVRSALPPEASFLAPYLASGIQQLVHGVALRTVQSSTFATLWDTLNRRAHAQVIAALKGQTKVLKLNNGEVVLSLGPVVDTVDKALNKVGVSGLSTHATPPNDELVLFSSRDLQHAQRAVRLLDNLATALPIVTVLFFAAAIALSPERRRTILRGGLGVAFGMALLLILFDLGRAVYLHALPAGVNTSAAQAVYDQFLTFLTRALRTLFTLATLTALGAWLAGPGRLATRIRVGARALVRRTPGRTRVSPPVAGFAQRYRNSLRVTAVGIGLAVLTALSSPGPVAVLAVALLILLTLAGIELLARGAPAPAEPRA